ncbi:type VI secretion system-associated protein TagF [Thetidibacter halocola]|uniref:Type VI secretion system-associated protein TagF n=1 Tax=Thetidibacter halocola TaxID=2827239 RepID=A0A8J8B7B4_9RHOB|nr:type VI secretion system-associated protein TagF [Thetidibacter halocola]MBS0123544.1 type VI secretion system-associated protein TagF [Thetidibacter halocola]
MPASIGLMGKHPAFGDFVQAGLTDRTVSVLSLWLDRSLADLRETMGHDWPAFWDGAQGLRFWIGHKVTGRGLAGVLRPSRDRVGRRYPLLMLAEGVALPLPMQDTDQSPWEAFEAHLAGAHPADGSGAAGLLAGFKADLPEETDAMRAEGAVLWAHHPEGDLAALLRSAGRADPARAALGRSYWWSPGDSGRLPVWLGCDGLPGAQALGWLLGGTARAEGGRDAAE